MVGFLYGAGAETIILATRVLGKVCGQAEKPKPAVYTQKNKKNSGLGIQCWDPSISGGYQNCGLGIRSLENRSKRNLEMFSKVLELSAPALYKRVAVVLWLQQCDFIAISEGEACDC